MAVAEHDPSCHVLVIAGGSGTRFWPKSRQDKPKQLLKIWDDKTLLEHTLERFLPWKSATLNVVTTEALVAPSRHELDHIKADIKFIAETLGRNTAPCILLGMVELKAKGNDVVCIVPADHYIKDPQAFRESMQKAVSYARTFGGIVTLGIKPDRPETGYGYIEMGSGLSDGFASVAEFVEKPDLRQALNYMKSGKHLWNAGIFVFRVDVGMKAYQLCMPELFEALTSTGTITQRYDRIRAKDAISIDFGVMEHVASKGVPVAVLAVDYGWSDLGSYTALEEIDKSVLGNVVSHNSASNIVQCDEGLVAILGVNDLVVVKEGNVVLVAAKDRCQDIRKLVERVRKDYPQFS